MNKLSKVTLEEFVSAVEKNKCPFCKKKIKLTDFKDLFYLNEYEITGMCQTCMDETYGKE